MDLVKPALELFVAAGATMVPIVLASVLAVGLVLHKLWVFRAERVFERAVPPEVEAALDGGDVGGLLETLDGAPGVRARVLRETALGLRDAPGSAEDEAVVAANVALGELQWGLGALAFIAQVSPLLGLLGTVLGLVELFSDMESAATAVSTATLSSGIWKALLTTAAGLLVAIPALAGHAFLRGWLDRLRTDLEALVAALLHPVLGRRARPRAHREDDDGPSVAS
jgi:biopolymer transport protein ExbB